MRWRVESDVPHLREYPQREPYRVTVGRNAVPSLNRSDGISIFIREKDRRPLHMQVYHGSIQFADVAGGEGE